MNVRVEDRLDGIRLDAALGRIDAALAMGWRQEIFTKSEATALLIDVRTAVTKVTREERVLSILDGAVASFDGELLDHIRVVDPLLDLRLALAA